MKMYCHNYDCDVEVLDVTKITHDLYTVDFHTLSASSTPVCHMCGLDLSTDPLSVPEPFSKVVYPSVRGKGSSYSGKG